MSCLTPICIRSPGLKPGEPFHYVLVPCGRCVDCLKRRQQDWSIRIQKETDDCLSKGGSSYFISMTYDDEHLVYTESDIPSLYPPDLQSFIKRLRRVLDYDLKVKLRFFGCGEYGDDFDRPHYHVVVWLDKYLSSEELRPYVVKCWNNGIVLGVKPMNVYYSEYVGKYSTKRFGIDYTGVIPPFARMSLRPAVGSCFVDSSTEEGKSNIEFYRKNNIYHIYDETHTPFALPRYYRNKIHTLDSVQRRFVELQESEYDSFLRRSRFDMSFLANQRFSEERYEEIFFKKLKYNSLNIKIL